MSIPPTSERPVWAGTPSQATNVDTFLLCALLAAGIVAAPLKLLPALPGWFYLFALVPAAVAVKAYLDIKTRRFELTTQRLRIAKGILSQRVDDLELYRVKDVTQLRPIGLRLMGLGNLVLTTSDQSTPVVVLEAIRDCRGVGDLLRQAVESERDRKGVREVEFTQSPGAR